MNNREMWVRGDILFKVSQQVLGPDKLLITSQQIDATLHHQVWWVVFICLFNLQCCRNPILDFFHFWNTVKCDNQLRLQKEREKGKRKMKKGKKKAKCFGVCPQCHALSENFILFGFAGQILCHPSAPADLYSRFQANPV